MLAHLHAAPAGEWAVLTYPVDSTLSAHGGVSRALCTVDAKGMLAAITEMQDIQRTGDRIVGHSEGPERTLDPATPVSMNLWGFTPEVFAPLETAFARFLRAHGEDADAEFRLPDAVSAMIEAGRRVRVLSSPGGWMGLTFAPDREHVSSRIGGLVRDGDYPPDLATERRARRG
jgi:hypothetical protein